MHLVSTLIIVQKQSQVRYPTCMSIFSHNVAKGMEKRTTKNVQLVLQQSVIAAKWVEQQCCAFYHPCSNLLTTWFIARQVWCGWWNAQHRYSTRFEAMMRDKLRIFCCPFFCTLRLFRNILNNVSGNNFYLLQRMNANYGSTALAIVYDEIIKLLLTLKPAPHQNF